MSTAFVRQLGAEAGVRLNPLRDDSEIPTQDNYDQVIATALKATRGRIDKPFKVNRSNIARLLGVGQPTRINQLNESYLHVAEALNKGAYEVVVQRLVHNDPSPNYIVVKHGSGATASAVITAGAVSGVTIAQGGSGYTSAATISFSGGGGTGASATLNIVDGKIISIANLVGGSGYTAAPDASVLDGGSGAQTRVGTKDGVIAKIKLTSGGSGYTGTTTVSITDSGGTGTGATATVTKSSNVITGITGMPFGTGFKKQSKITVDNGSSGGTGLKLEVAKVNKSGAITSITILSGGSGYTGAPTIKVGGKVITGITFKKSQNVITGINVTNGGEGYTSPVVSFSGTPTVAAIANAVVRNNVIDTITVVNGGSGYPANPTVTIGKGTSNGSGAKATAVTANNVITAVEVTAGGTGYTNGAAVTGTFSGGGGTGAAAKAVISGGAVVSVEITNGGSGYTSTPTLTFPAGTGATFAFTKKNGVLKSVTVVEGGGNYIGSKVRIEEGGGTGAIATASLVSAPLTGITVVDAGSNYDDPPKIEIIGGGGSGAAATAVLENGAISEITLDAAGSGYTDAPKIIIKDVTSFDVGDTEPPDESCLFAVKHLECFNEGIKVAFWADEKRSLVDNTITTIDNDKITVWLKDTGDKVLYEFSGSLKQDALDDFGNSAYLPDVVSAMTDAVEIVVSAAADSISFHSSAYGYDDNGLRNIVESDPDKAIVYFAEDDGRLDFDDYAAARVKLQLTPHNYAYICNCGNEDKDLIGQFAQLAFDTNRQFKIDVSSTEKTKDDPDAAVNEVIRKVEEWGLGSKPGSHLLHAYWTRFSSADPTGVNPKARYGTATLNAAYACARNAQTNARGFAPKNYPIAGRNWPVSRSGVVHDPGLTSQNLNALARAKINPVMFETYTGGGRSVFRDSLTSALVESSLIKLIAVADMSTSIDDAVTRFAKDVEQLPMDDAIKKTKDFLKALFEGAQVAKWIVPSSDPAMYGAAFKFEVKPNEVRPYDRMDVNYWLRYDGTVRQIFVTQTLSL